MSFVGKQMELEIIMLSELNQTQNTFFHMWNLDLKKKDMKVDGGLWKEGVD
jgi:hypothetical protein